MAGLEPLLHREAIDVVLRTAGGGCRAPVVQFDRGFAVEAIGQVHLHPQVGTLLGKPGPQTPLAKVAADGHKAVAPRRRQRRVDRRGDFQLP